MRLGRSTILVGTLSAALTAGAGLGTVAQASTSAKPHHQMIQKTIILNGKTVTKPYGFTSGNTMYMPIWYVYTALQSLGIKSVWKNNVWNLQVPSTYAIDTSNIQVGTGPIELEINGKLMHKVYGIADIDPSSGQATTFIPIWYTQQLLSRIGISSPWDGTTWTLQTGSQGGNPMPTPPVLPANEVAAWQVIDAVEKAFNITTTSGGTSPYDDIASTDSHFAALQTAVQTGIYSPDSKTHSGVYEAISVNTVDTMLWNAFGIENAPFQAGGEPFAWANAVNLNPTGVAQTDLLTPQELAQIVSNLADNMRGYSTTGTDSYQIRYPVRDEAVATFNGDSTSGQPFYTSNTDVQNAISAVYQFYDNISVTDQDGQWVLTMPSLADTSWFSYATTLGDVQYELPGSSTWQSIDTLDSRDLSVSSSDQIRVRIPGDAGLSIAVNQMLPQLGGTVALGEIQVSVDPANGLVVQRININQ